MVIVNKREMKGMKTYSWIVWTDMLSILGQALIYQVRVCCF